VLPFVPVNIPPMDGTVFFKMLVAVLSALSIPIFVDMIAPFFSFPSEFN
jgi:hypothetical protein